MSGHRGGTGGGGGARRIGRGAGVLATVGLLGGLLGGCGGGGSSALVQEACGHVSRSIQLYERSTHQHGAMAERTRAAALVQLRRALRPAALAGSAGGQFQALQASLSESSRVPEGELVSALSAECSSAGTS